MLTLALHDGLEIGSQNLPPKLHDSGFAKVETGETGFWSLGFVRGETHANMTGLGKEQDRHPGSVERYA
jgi:hypothetical protein